MINSAFIFIAAITNCHKFSSLKQDQLTISQFGSIEAWVGTADSLGSRFHKAEINCRQDCMYSFAGSLSMNLFQSLFSLLQQFSTIDCRTRVHISFLAIGQEEISISTCHHVPFLVDTSSIFKVSNCGLSFSCFESLCFPLMLHLSSLSRLRKFSTFLRVHMIRLSQP